MKVARLGVALVATAAALLRPALAAPEGAQAGQLEAADWWRGYEAAPRVSLRV